ncbi:RpiB/LacA/LacB family sugar-phosphate isomerase [Erysipelothrix urinaevulpis]|uniref:RpiB/LacA/LacB family sugar-phosphate isomerase n=1 Tax=Erysipelothrix urinaevulpis TaxID=2683717 RepID=UPI001356CC3B|nr:RpiB/LacA/LacB family sugar-phosphate isomerase [Erysipelothrix urinaevulpis]
MIYISATPDGLELKNNVLLYLDELDVAYEDLTKKDANTISATQNVVKKVLEDNAFGIVVDGTGNGPFMVAGKYKGIICAQLNDEQSALMTRDHNNTNIITLGQDIIGNDVMRGIVNRFVTHDYAGGRHQIRVDMLDSMLEEPNL